MLKQLPLLIVGVLLSLGLSGQDIHFSQFMNTPLHVSPGLTGVFSGDTRVGATYRSQWSEVPANYRTFSAYADHKYTCGRNNAGFWSAGIAVNYDRAGDLNLTWANVGLYGSYTQPLSSHALITLGATLGLGQRSFDTDDIRSGSQFNEAIGRYDSSLGIGENFNRTSLIFLDFGIGANFRWQARHEEAVRRLAKARENRKKRSKLDVGVGIHHLNQPDMSFIDDQDANLPIRIAAYGDGLIKLADPLDLRLAFQAQFQDVYREYLGMANAKIHLNQNRGKELALALGIGLRFNEFTDAWFPMLELHHRNQLRVGLSYDVNISDFEVATNNRGGFEISLRYLFKKVCPIPNTKYCPPFI